MFRHFSIHPVVCVVLLTLSLSCLISLSAAQSFGCFPCQVTACAAYNGGVVPQVSISANATVLQNASAAAATECATLNNDIAGFIYTSTNASCGAAVTALTCEVIATVNETEVNCNTAGIGIGTPLGNQTYFQQVCQSTIPCLGYVYQDELVATNACSSFEVFAATVIAQPAPSTSPCLPCNITSCYGLADTGIVDVTFYAGSVPSDTFACPALQSVAANLLANASPYVPLSFVQTAVCDPLSYLVVEESFGACQAGELDATFDGIIFEGAALQNQTWTPFCLTTISELFNAVTAQRLISSGYCISPSGGLNAYASAYVSIPGFITTASLCLIFYSNPGNVDYPWSISVNMNIFFNSTTVTNAYGTAVQIINGTGTHTFTNRFGTVTTTAFTVAAAGTDYADNLLYVNSPLPFDKDGLTLNLASALQLPGHGPTKTYSQVNIYNASGFIVESDVFRIDPLGSAFLSTVPLFNNVTIGASNINALSASYGTCTAPITFTNGLRVPTQPSAANGGTHIYYSYYLSDGVNYTVQTNLTMTASTAFANVADLLGNPYQTITSVTGSRLYTYLPTGAQLRSTISGLTTGAYAYADQRFYPYALISSAPGVYTINSAPFVDYDGVEFGVSPSVPALGYPVGQGVQYNATSIYITTTEATAVLTEGYYLSLPNVNYQQQSYTFST